MERALGIGGIFFRATDPIALAGWYRERLGIEAYATDHDAVWWPESGPTVFAPFAVDTDYFGRPDQAWMLNVRVADLDRMLDQLRAASVEVVGDVQTLAGIGRFAWVVDPEGNRIELWEPAPEALVRPSAGPGDE